MSDLPTKPGHYYWRRKDGDGWRIIQVYLVMLNDEPEVNGMCCESPLSGEYVHVSEIDGEWLQIPTAEELVELQAAKKMVDEKHDGWAIFQRGEFCLSVPTQDYVIRLIEKITGYPWVTLSSEANYTCEPVTIVRKAKR